VAKALEKISRILTEFRLIYKRIQGVTPFEIGRSLTLKATQEIFD
jgi:hypothetical protein